MRSKRLLCCLMAVIFSLIVPASAETVYLPTSHDTRPAPDKAEFAPVDLSDYTLLYESGCAITGVRTVMCSLLKT